jgi:hypothetical protein
MDTVIKFNLPIESFVFLFAISTRSLKYTEKILDFVLYGCETWYLLLRNDQRLQVFGIRVLTVLFGSKREEVTGDWRKLHKGEFRDLYCSLNIIRMVKSRRMRQMGQVR